MFCSALENAVARVRINVSLATWTASPESLMIVICDERPPSKLLMLDLLKLVNQSRRSIGDDLKRWFAPYDSGAAYYVVSDHCWGDAGNKHDVYASIEEYIRALSLRGAATDSPALVHRLQSQKEPTPLAVSRGVLHDILCRLRSPSKRCLVVETVER